MMNDVLPIKIESKHSLITYFTEQCDHMQLCDIFREENDYSFLRYHDDEQKTRRR